MKTALSRDGTPDTNCLADLIRFRPRPTRCRQERALIGSSAWQKALAGVEDVDQRAFANVQANRSRSTWLNRASGMPGQSADRSQRRAGLARTAIPAPSLRRLGLEALGATRADTAMQRHARHVGLDLRDFDAVIGFARALRDAGYVGAAALARVWRRHRPGIGLA